MKKFPKPASVEGGRRKGSFSCFHGQESHAFPGFAELGSGAPGCPVLWRSFRKAAVAMETPAPDLFLIGVPDNGK